MTATYRLAHYSIDGRRVHDVQYGGLPLIPAQDDDRADWTRQYALDTFKNARGSAVLLEWDGDTGEEIELHRKGNR